MARQRGKKFQADVIVNVVRHRPSFFTREEAVAYENAVHKGFLGVGATSFKQFHQTHFEHLWGDNKSPQATRYGLDALDQFIPATMPVTEISSSYILEVVARMKATGVSNGTINRRLSVISRLLKHAERLELMKRPHIDFLREPQGRERVLSAREETKMGRFFKHMGLEQSWAVTFFLLYTGCRLGEVFSLERDRVSDGRVMFHYTVTKTSKTRLVPLVGPAKDAWEFICGQCDEEKPFSVLPRDTYRDHWNRMRLHMGLTHDAGFIPHMLRHTCASRLVSKGVPLSKVMLWMGHTSIQTTMRYSHLAPQDLEGVGAALWPE